MKFLAIAILAASTIAGAQTTSPANACPTCDGEFSVTYTGKPNAALPANTMGWEATYLIPHSFIFSAPTQALPPVGTSVILGATMIDATHLKMIFVPLPPTCPLFTPTWNGTQWVCLTAAQYASQLASQGYYMIQSSSPVTVPQ